MANYWVQRQQELERERARREREQLRLIRAAEKLRREKEREQAREEKERQKIYVEGRIAETDRQNRDLQTRVETLNSLLGSALTDDDYIDFEALKEHPETPTFYAGALGSANERPLLEEPDKPKGLAGILPGAKAKYTKALADAEAAHAAAIAEWETHEQRRIAKLEELRRKHDAAVAEILSAAEARNREVDAFRAAFEAGDPEAVVNYFSLVLAASRYPDDFPKQNKVAFVPESKQLVVEYDLPGFDAVPEVREYRYVKSKDQISEAARPATQRKSLYAGLVAQIALRTLHELFEADRAKHLETVVLNAYVDSIDKRTGHQARPCLVTVRTSRDTFLGLDLTRVEPQECLKGLNAAVSKSPSELVPVRPVLEFNMVDSRFIEETDVLGSLDDRPNLMELSPSEFEALITNLFEKMGLETRLTQASRDGGVDCVAFDPRPIFGGKVVIQAKRYKNTVGVSAVRDLFGTMQNEGASKGILVTTSGYGKASFEFADGKPLELLSGTNLLYLLEEYAGIQAKIEPPEDWVDPTPEIEVPTEHQARAT